MPTFPKELSVGNRIIDSEHKKLYDIIKMIASSIEASDVAALSKAFDLFDHCLCEYFAVEDNIAQALEFDFTYHRVAHYNLLGSVKRIKDGLMKKNGMWSAVEKHTHINSLRDLLIRHIKEDGKPFKAVLDTHFYDFKPS